MATPFEKTVDGLEKQLAVDHIAHHYLTSRLMSLLTASATEDHPSRIVYLSSTAHLMAPSTLFPIPGKLDEEKTYSAWPAYGRAKVANILDARAWAKRTDTSKVLINAIHPGAVNTELFDKATGAFSFINPVIVGAKNAFGSLFLKTPDQGCVTSLYVATSTDIVKNKWSGCYFEPYGVKKEPSKLARNDEEMEKLWTWTEETIERVLQGKATVTESKVDTVQDQPTEDASASAEPVVTAEVSTEAQPSEVTTSAPVEPVVMAEQQAES